MSKKVTIIHDELKIQGGGIYCYLPYDRLDIYKKAVFKIGLAIDFKKRIEQYHTYFPLGVYMCGFLSNPPIPRSTRAKQMTTKIRYLEIEKFILNYIDNHGGKRIYSTTRVKNPNLDKEGETEWIYTSEDVIHDAFSEAHKKFGGKLDLYYLEGLNPKTGKIESINDLAKESEKKKPQYVGKIIFHL